MLRKNVISRDCKDDKTITMEKSELNKVIDAKLEAQKVEFDKKSEDEKASLKKEYEEHTAKAIAKAEANRKSIEDTGLQLDGSVASGEQAILATIEKSEKYGSRLTDFDIDFKKASDDLVFMNYMFNADSSKKANSILETKAFKTFHSLVKKMHKSYDEGSTTGAEWLHTNLSSRLVEMVVAQNDYAIASKFPQITMTSKTFELPRSEANPTAYLGSIGGTPYGSGAGDTTGKATFTAEKIIAYTKTAYEQDEDQMFALIPYIESQLTKSIARGVTNAIINGDTAGTMDDGILATYDVRLAWDGLRKICQTNSYTKSIGAVWSTTLMRKFVSELDLVYGMNFSDLLFIVGKDSFTQFRNLAEVSTLDKIGSIATILNGTLSAIDGIEIAPTDLLLDAVSASGVINPTAANNTKGQALVVAKSAFALGTKRSIMLESDKNIKTQEIDIVGSMRGDFQSIIKASGQQAVCQAINITKF